jgi:hypothetical protein
MVVFEFKTIVPERINTSVKLSGTAPQLQLAGFSQAVLTVPFQVFANCSEDTLL